MKNNILKILSIISVIVGVFLIIIQPLSPTGAVIDLSTGVAKANFIVGLILVIVGATLLTVELKE